MGRASEVYRSNSGGYQVNRAPFLDAPQTWLQASRRSQSLADYANPIERPTSRENVAGVMLACAIGLVMALALVQWWAA